MNSYIGLVIPETYRAYAETEADALAIVSEIERVNFGKFTGIIRKLPYLSSTWAISLSPKEAN